VFAGALLNFGCSRNYLIFRPALYPSAPWTIKTENAKPGSADWQLTDLATNREIEGFASATSVDRGQDISIYVNTAEPTYTMQVYRMGWYAGAGAREMTPPIVRSGTVQPMPAPDPQTGLLECHWTDPYVLHIPKSSDPTDWASGVYLVKLTAGVSGKQRFVMFVVRDDERSSDLLFQLGVNTSEAYNAWGGWSLYTTPRAYKVSFDRPYQHGRGTGLFFEWEYDMVRFLEREGYDLSYSTDVDTDMRGALLLQHKAFIDVGHDEYWTWQMRDNVEHARDSGLNLGFFAGNTSYWQIRYEPGAIDAVPDRTIVCYKNATQDPMAENSATRYLTTTAFRASPVKRPEESMLGAMYLGWFDGPTKDMVITDASSWIFAHTGAQNRTHLPGLLGYECDRLEGSHPPGTGRVAHSPWIGVKNQVFYSDMTYYISRSGSTVVDTGTMSWSWGLDDFHRDHPVYVSPIVQQATRNILKKFGATDPAQIPLP
jgi:hypothetical protein